MNLHTCGNVARWIARLLGLLYFAFIAFFLMAHALSPDGLPPVWRFSLAEKLDALALFLMAIGSVVGWKWEGVAAVMVLGGTALWVLLEQNLPWPPGGTVLIGALYAFTFWCTKQPSRGGGPIIRRIA
jgi:hypothetical protein